MVITVAVLTPTSNGTVCFATRYRGEFFHI
jgi:hypothetical protein